MMLRNRNALVLLVVCTLLGTGSFSVAGEAEFFGGSKLSVGQLEKCIVGNVQIPKLNSMSLKERIGQMVQVKHSALSKDGDVYTFKIGSIYNDAIKWSTKARVNASHWAKVVDNLQAKARKTPLRIPIIWGESAIHGHGVAYDATIFPHHIGLAASRNPSLVKKISRAVAEELLATGARWTFSPSVNLCKNPLVDLCYEEFGSNADLVSKMMSEIEGWQEKSTNKLDSVYEVAGDVLISSAAKISGGVPSQADSKPLVKAIETGVLSILTDSSEASFVSGSLKSKLKFQGVVLHEWAERGWSKAEYKNRVQSIVNGGVDVVRIGKGYTKFIDTLHDLVRSRSVPVSRINDAVERVLRMKKKLGLFQKGGCSYPSFLNQVGSPSHRALARAAVRKSLVLLKNNLRGSGRPLFPISLGYTRVVVTGSHANDLGLQSGGWTVTRKGASGNITKKGTTVFEGIQKALVRKNGGISPLLTQNPSGHEQADYGIIVVGEKPYSKPPNTRSSLHLDSKSENIIRTVCFSTPCVLVLMSGRPLKIDHLLPQIDAVIAAWLPGSEGEGIADLLFGTDYDFEGRLPVDWFKNPMRLGSKDNTLFPFGHGLKKSGRAL